MNWLPLVVERLIVVGRAVAGARPSSLGMRALEVAIGELGHGEEVGNNAGKHVAKYKGLANVPSGDLGPWCASFVSWCLMQIGGEDPLRLGDPKRWARKRHGAKALFRLIGEAGRYVTDPQPGDVACWHRGAQGSWEGHIGFVSAAPDGGILPTVEGNVGSYPSTVRRFVHDLARDDRLLGFARLP